MGDVVADVEEGGMVRTLKDLFSGAAGGVAQVLLGELFLSELSNQASTLASLFRYHVGLNWEALLTINCSGFKDSISPIR